MFGRVTGSLRRLCPEKLKLFTENAFQFSFVICCCCHAFVGNFAFCVMRWEHSAFFFCLIFFLLTFCFAHPTESVMLLKWFALVLDRGMCGGAYTYVWAHSTHIVAQRQGVYMRHGCWTHLLYICKSFRLCVCTHAAWRHCCFLFHHRRRRCRQLLLLLLLRL